MSLSQKLATEGGETFGTGVSSSSCVLEVGGRSVVRSIGQCGRVLLPFLEVSGLFAVVSRPEVMASTNLVSDVPRTGVCKSPVAPLHCVSQRFSERAPRIALPPVEGCPCGVLDIMVSAWFFVRMASRAVHIGSGCSRFQIVLGWRDGKTVFSFSWRSNQRRRLGWSRA